MQILVDSALEFCTDGNIVLFEQLSEEGTSYVYQAFHVGTW